MNRKLTAELIDLIAHKNSYEYLKKAALRERAKNGCCVDMIVEKIDIHLDYCNERIEEIREIKFSK